jgi:hypothetical protein
VNFIAGGGGGGGGEAEDVHRLLGESLVRLVERERAVVVCGLHEQRPGRDGEPFQPRSPPLTECQEPARNKKTLLTVPATGCDPNVPSEHAPASLRPPPQVRTRAVVGKQLCCRPGTAVKLLWPGVNPASAGEDLAG